MKKKNGRPIEFSDKTIEKANAYISSCFDTNKDGLLIVRLPSIEGLALYLDVHKDTLYDWEGKYKNFSDVIRKVRDLQAQRLMENGLAGTYNPTIAKLLLVKHGYRDAIDNDLTSKGDKITGIILDK